MSICLTVRINVLFLHQGSKWLYQHSFFLKLFINFAQDLLSLFKLGQTEPILITVSVLTSAFFQDSHNWVMAFYRATGQAHKPAPPVNTGKNTAMNKSGPGQVRI